VKALVLSGGGSNGDDELGAARYLAETGHEYDAFVGVSTGALNAAAFAMFHRLADGVAFMLELYRGLAGNHSICRGEPLLRAGTGCVSMYDATPLHELVRAKLDPRKVEASGKRLAVGAVQVGYGGEEAYRTFVDPRGSYREWSDEHHDNSGPERHYLHQAVLASSAYPVAFQPVKVGPGWRDPWYSDGGLRRPVPVQDAIDLGATEIDVLATSTASRRSKPLDPGNAPLWEMALDAVSILAQQAEAASLAAWKPGVSIRIFRPSRDLGDSLAFGADKKSPTHEENFALGYEDARRQVG
jgi:NTE family protein